MFERFTDRARRVLVFAEEEARRLDHDHVGTAHLLLGIVREGDGMAATALEAHGIALSDIREHVEAITGRGAGAVPEHLVFTPGAKRALELALREARQLEHDYIGTEHVLLGLVREGDGVAAQVLGEFGASLTVVRSQVMRTLIGHAAAERAEAPEREPAAGAQMWDAGWMLLASGTAATWRALDLARQGAAVDAHPAVEVGDLILGILRAGDPQVANALAAVGAAASPADLQPDAAGGDGPLALPLSEQAREAFVHAMRLAEEGAGALGAAHLLLGCLSVLDPGPAHALTARLGFDPGQLAEHLGGGIS